MMFEDDLPAPSPDWVLTYGDMMSLLLTFFVMLASMSELKETDRYQGVADSLQNRFGYDDPLHLTLAGGYRPRNSVLAAAAGAARARREAVLGTSEKERSGQANPQPARMLRPGDRTTIGAVIYFADDTAEVSAANQADLGQLADSLYGKPHKIEVRGHAAFSSLANAMDQADAWELSYRRARAVMQFLVTELNIDAQRIRISVAGPYEPLHLGAGPDHLRNNPRVEVFLLDEVASDLVGTPREKKLRVIDTEMTTPN